jgi:hypothetical protein
MSDAHPLLTRAQKYLRQDHDLSPPGCTYNRLVGAWVDNRSGILAVQLTDRPRPQTKKADFETGGEDHKGA